MQTAPKRRSALYDDVLAPAAVVAAAVGFALAVNARGSTSGWFDLALTALVLVGSALAAHYASRPNGARAAGAVTALVAAWLFAQRDDFGSVLVLAAFFGAGLGLIASRSDDDLATAGFAIPAITLLTAVRFALSWHLVVTLIAASAALLIIAALTASKTPDTSEPSATRRSPRLTATILIMAVAIFAAYVGAETPSAHWFGGGITHGQTDSAPEVAITFDDGPNLSSTLPIMRILDAAHVKATFFEVGKAIDADPQITRALYKDGQGLGNHSYHHDQWRWLDPRYPELERTQKAFQRAIGVCPAFYRPPHGERTPFLAHVVNSHHMRMILWDDSSGDWAVKSPHTIARRILRGVHPGSIIVLHDGLDGIPTANRTVLVKAMPLILAGLRAKGLQPVRLDQLIGGPAFRPC